MVAATKQQQKQVAAATMTVAGATKTLAEEEALKRNTDCIYFLASPLTCKKGSECEYRHSEYARVNPRDCYYWLNGNCLNPKCGFRHPPLDGLLGTQVAAPAGSSSHTAATPTPASHTPYNQGASYSSSSSSSSSKQAVPCIFFQKGLCLKGDRCAFLHGPTTSNKAPQPATTTTATECHSLKKVFGTLETSQLQKFPRTNFAKTVAVPPEGKPAPKIEAAFARSGNGTERSVPRSAGLDEELPGHKGTNTTSVINGGSVGRFNRLHQAYASDEPSFHSGKETDEFLRESSPGFDVLVDDELRGSDFYHGEDQYGGTRGHEGRNVNEYDIGHSATYDAMIDVDRERFLDGGYDSFDHVQGNYGWDQQRASSERISLGPSTLERRGYSRADSLDHIEDSDLRHRLFKHSRVNGLKSVVTHDHALENHEGEQNYRGSSLRDSHHLPPHGSSRSSGLWGRIKLPGSSVVNGTDLRSEREIERGQNWGRLSPGKPQTTSHQGRLCDRIKERVEGEFNNKGRNFGGSRIKREVMDGRNADFAGPKSLAELKVGKNTDNKDLQSLGKRKCIEDYQQTEGDLSFEGPMTLSEILKRKRQSEAAASGTGIVAAVYKEDVNQKQSKGSLISSSTNTVVSMTPEEANRKEESKSTTADIGATEVALGESSQLRNISEDEADNGVIADENLEDHELEADDQRDADYYYEGDEVEYNHEEGENVDPEEEYIEEEDGDDFAKKLGVMFS